MNTPKEQNASKHEQGQQFSELQLPFSESDPCSLYYKQLQHILQDLKGKDIDNLMVNKLDRVLLDVYSQTLKQQKKHYESTLTLHNMLAECTNVVNDCKDDRQNLKKVTQDRQQLLDRLKEATNDSLGYLQQNQKLHLTMNKMQELNTLLVQKNDYLQAQLKNRMDSIEGTRNLMELQEQYNAIIADNVEIQKELVEISTKTKLLEVVALPLQVVSFACQGEPSVKKIIWSAVETSPTQHFENMELTKQLFMDFDFIGLLTSLQTA